MLSGFFRKSHKQDSKPEDVQPPAPRADVPYDPSLVTALTMQHRALGLLLVTAASAAQQGRFEEVAETLAQFKRELTEHLKREKEQLEPYLAAHLRGEDGKTVLRELHSSTVHIERSVEGFLSHYLSYPVGERNVMRFGIEISGVSEEFCDRIEGEEAQFYTLYLAPDAY